MSALSVRYPKRAASREERIKVKAAELEKLTAYDVALTFNPTESFPDDPASLGNIIRGSLADSFTGEDQIFLDLRKGKLRKQLASELRRVAKMYRKLARRVEGGAR